MWINHGEWFGFDPNHPSSNRNISKNLELGFIKPLPKYIQRQYAPRLYTVRIRG